ncbi:MAG TPA: adenylate kinase [Acidimicrobiia bacterium]|nr:adenylate kinase [Acidimicrobiia bacterium]
MRFAVVGTTGVGKTTLARSISQCLSIPHVELDGIYHQAGWKRLPEGEFRTRIIEEVGRPAWVIDGNYSEVRDLVWAAADAVIFLDYPRSVIMSRVIRRSLGRAATRRRLWNGDRESFKNLLSRDPEENIIRWASAGVDTLHQRYLSATNDPKWSGLNFVRLADPRQAAVFMAALGS